MKTKILLMTTIMSTGLMLTNIYDSYAADSITKSTINTANSPMTNEEISDPRVAANSFVEHVNYARVALAMKSVDIAKQHISQARNMSIIANNATADQRLAIQLPSGRIVYQYDTEYKYHYFPIQTGPVQVKKISSGSVWAKNSLAVTDADIVYLTLDLKGDKAEKYLKASENAIEAGNLKEADNQLAMLTDAVVTVDLRASVPGDKAHDNIALARNFIAGENYDGASYALKHADEALDKMQKSKVYKDFRTEISSMRKDVKDLQDYIAKKDPTMIRKADNKLESWLNNMKIWAKSKK